VHTSGFGARALPPTPSEGRAGRAYRRANTERSMAERHRGAKPSPGSSPAARQLPLRPLLYVKLMAARKSVGR
jgi:hypothetical protein